MLNDTQQQPASRPNTVPAKLSKPWHLLLFIVTMSMLLVMLLIVLHARRYSDNSVSGNGKLQLRSSFKRDGPSQSSQSVFADRIQLDLYELPNNASASRSDEVAAGLAYTDRSNLAPQWSAAPIVATIHDLPEHPETAATFISDGSARNDSFDTSTVGIVMRTDSDNETATITISSTESKSTTTAKHRLPVYSDALKPNLSTASFATRKTPTEPAILNVEAAHNDNAFLQLRVRHRLYFRRRSPTHSTQLNDVGSKNGDVAYKTHESVHRALRTGRLNEAPQPDAQLSSTLYDSLKLLLDIGGTTAFFEHSHPQRDNTQLVSRTVATEFPSVTSILVQIASNSDDSTTSIGEQLSAPSNLFIATLDTADFAQSFLALPPHDCAQAIADVDLLATDLLPFEFERMLGDFFCVCRTTFLSRDLPTTNFFAYWKTSKELVANAAASRKDKSCVLDFDADRRDLAFVQKAKYSYLVVRRNDTTATTVASDASEVPDAASALTLPKAFLPLSVFAQLHFSADSTQRVGNMLLTYLIEQFQSRPFPAHTISSKTTSLGSVLDFSDEFSLQLLSDLAVRGSRVVNASSVDTTTNHAGWDAYHWRQRESDQENVVSSAPTSSDSNILSDSDSGGNTMNANVTYTVANATQVEANKLTAPNTTEPAQPRRRLWFSWFNAYAHKEDEDTDVLPQQTFATAWQLYGIDGDETDARILDAQRQVARALSKNRTESSKQSNTAVGAQERQGVMLGKKSRDLQKRLHATEAEIYKRWVYMLSQRQPGSRLSAVDRVRASSLVYVAGGHASMLSIKLCKAVNSKARSNSKRRFKKTRPKRRDSKQPQLVVSLLSDATHARAHEHLLEVMNIRNNVVLLPAWTAHTVAALLGAPERADVFIVQADVVVSLLLTSAGNLSTRDDECGLALFESMLAVVSMLSATTYLELPSIQVLARILSFSDEDCAVALRDRYNSSLELLRDSLQSSGAACNFTVSNLSQVGYRSSAKLDSQTDVDQPAEFEVTTVFQISSRHQSLDSKQEVHRQKIALFNSDSRQKGARSHTDDATSVRSAFSNPRGPDSQGRKLDVEDVAAFSRTSSLGISMYTLQLLRPSESSRAKLLNLLLNFPLWSLSKHVLDQVRPWNLFVRLSSAYNSSADAEYSTLAVWHYDHAKYVSASGSSRTVEYASQAARRFSSNAKGALLGATLSDDDCMSDESGGKVLFHVVSEELRTHAAETANGRFSFTVHGSGDGFFSIKLALRYPNATIISIEKDAARVKNHVELAAALGVNNNAVCRREEELATVFHNLYDSPELFRFQLLPHTLFAEFAASKTLHDWGVKSAKLLSTALTSFVAVPTAQQCSWAMHLVFGELLYTQADNTANYKRHTLPVLYRDLEDSFSGDKSSFDALYVQLEESNSDNEDNMLADDVLAAAARLVNLEAHPQAPYKSFSESWLLRAASLDEGSTQLLVSPMQASSEQTLHANSLQLPFVRCDVVNMTRHVHHHYDYSRDGHKRTYTMHVRNDAAATLLARSRLSDVSNALVSMGRDHLTLTRPDPAMDGGLNAASDRELNATSDYTSLELPPGFHPNQHSVVQVSLRRDKDDFPIPYTSIHGVTLITALRLGLSPVQREQLFKAFLRLPLYEDMAPWNIVLVGPNLDYIDYDTKAFTFDLDVPKAYMVMTILMNYKRTVEDFKRCGTKASTVYGLPFVSDCVGADDRSLSCPDLKRPVPCADGHCHTDYISCLRALSTQAEEALAALDRNETHAAVGPEEHLASAMRSMVGRFDNRGYSQSDYADFLRALS